MTGGRSDINDIVISDSSVSASHFELRLEEKGVRLIDLGSRNGTFVGSVRVRNALLEANTTFSLAGRCEIRLVAAMEAEVPLSREASFGSLYGGSTVMRELFPTLEKLSDTPLSVLVEGETGTGKELVAKALHEHSSRANGRFVVFDCTNLPRDLAESMILGYRRGVFTGATNDQPGLFEEADGGTVFLDEIGELPLSLQPKLLRVLSNEEVVRVGETRRRGLNVRVVAATHRDLRAMVADGRFREDLYYRIAEYTVRLPSLRARGDDVLELAQRFLAEACTEQEKHIELGSDVRNWLMAEQWPGNVRQLRSVMRRAAYMGNNVISSKDLAQHWKSSSYHGSSDDSLFNMPLAHAKREFTYRYITHLLKQTNGNMSEAARLAGYSPQGLRLAMKRAREEESSLEPSVEDGESGSPDESTGHRTQTRKRLTSSSQGSNSACASDSQSARSRSPFRPV